MSRDSNSATTREIGDYILERPKIGQGSYANVYKGYKKATKERVAIKAIFLTNPKLTKKILENLEFEIKTLSQIEHENIIRLYDIKKTSKHTFLFLEYCGGGDLSQIIKARGPLAEPIARRLFSHLALGLQCLQKANIVHRDLKPQNLLLTTADPTQAVLKIADFGLARVIDPQTLAETMCGSPLYMAPEVLRHSGYTAKADLWSVGAILYEMLFAKPPFNGQNLVHLINVIEREQVTFPENVPISKEAKSIITGLLQRDPNNRLSFEQFFNHPFLQIINTKPQSEPLNTDTVSVSESSQSMSTTANSSSTSTSEASASSTSQRMETSANISQAIDSTRDIKSSNSSNSTSTATAEQSENRPARTPLDVLTRLRSDSSSSLDLGTPPLAAAPPPRYRPVQPIAVSEPQGAIIGSNAGGLLNQQLNSHHRTNSEDVLAGDSPASYLQNDQTMSSRFSNLPTQSGGNPTAAIPIHGNRANLAPYVYDNGSDFTQTSKSAPIPIPSKHDTDDAVVGSSHSISPASSSLERLQRLNRPPRVPPWREDSSGNRQHSPPQQLQVGGNNFSSVQHSTSCPQPYLLGNNNHILAQLSNPNMGSHQYQYSSSSPGNNFFYPPTGGSPNSNQLQPQPFRGTYVQQHSEGKLDNSLDIERDYVLISSSDDVDGHSSIVSLSASGHANYTAVILDYSNLECDHNPDTYNSLLYVENRARQAWAIAEFAVIKEASCTVNDRIVAMALFIKCLDLLNVTYQHSKAITPSPRAEAVSKWLKKKFLSFFDRAEQLGNKLAAEGSTVSLYTTVRVEKLLYKYALDLARASAVEEFLQTRRNCEATYMRSLLILDYLKAECLLDSTDHVTLQTLRNEVQRRLEIFSQSKQYKV